MIDSYASRPGRYRRERKERRERELNSPRKPKERERKGDSFSQTERTGEQSIEGKEGDRKEGKQTAREDMDRGLSYA